MRCRAALLWLCCENVAWCAGEVVRVGWTDAVCVPGMVSEVVMLTVKGGVCMGDVGVVSVSEYERLVVAVVVIA